MQFLRVLAAVTIMALAACGEAEKGTIYLAKSLVTMSDIRGNAVYIVGERIADVGMLEELQARYRGAVVDTQFGENVIVPGLIEHHVHPFLGAVSEVRELIIRPSKLRLPHRIQTKSFSLAGAIIIIFTTS
jgi:imidazolonepropionase-like amidohydrolase